MECWDRSIACFLILPSLQDSPGATSEEKSCLMLIWQDHILLDPSNLCEDEIGESEILQKWLDISYTITNDKAAPILKDVVAVEWNIGRGGLPPKFNSSIIIAEVIYGIKERLDQIW